MMPYSACAPGQEINVRLNRCPAARCSDGMLAPRTRPWPETQLWSGKFSFPLPQGFFMMRAATLGEGGTPAQRHAMPHIVSVSSPVAPCHADTLPPYMATVSQGGPGTARLNQSSVWWRLPQNRKIRSGGCSRLNTLSRQQMERILCRKSPTWLSASIKIYNLKTVRLW